MKSKYVLLASAFLISGVTFAQKDELKDLKKIYDKEIVKAKDVSDYKATLAKSEPLIASAAEGDKIYLNFYKAAVPYIEMSEAMTKPENQANPKNAFKFFTPAKISELATNAEAVLSYEKQSGKPVLTKNIQQTIDKSKTVLINYAVTLGEEKRHKDAAIVLNSIYKLDKSNPDLLFYAASYAVNGEDYDAALKSYEELIKQNYSGEKVEYLAVSKVNGEESTFPTLAERDKAVKIGSHEKPRNENIKSKRGEIYKNMTLIYIHKNDVESAKKAIVDARKTNPDDSSLLLTEADLYLKTNDMASYERLAKEAIAKDPSNADLYYNLGVISTKSNPKDAETYYKKAIELKPDYTNAYINLAILIIEADVPLVDEMNKLGNTPKENKRYDELKAKREGIFKRAMPYLEKAVNLDPKNQDASKTLLNVYNYLEMTAEAKALKAKTAQ